MHAVNGAKRRVTINFIVSYSCDEFCVMAFPMGYRKIAAQVTQQHRSSQTESWMKEPFLSSARFVKRQHQGDPFPETIETKQMNSNDRTCFYSGSEQEITKRAAALIIAEAYHAIADHGRFSLVLAGGNSPRLLYQHLAQGVSGAMLEHYGLPVPGGSQGNKRDTYCLPPNTWLFEGDERCVPPDHPDSNYRMIRETLLRQSGITHDHFFRMAGEKADTDQAARAYEATIHTFFFSDMSCSPQQFPFFDLVLLGLGEDGHTASLFADNPEALQESEKWVIAVDAPHARPPGKRLTLTLPIINHAGNVLFFTTGREKSELAKKIFLEEEKSVPASLVKPAQGRLYWFAAQL